MAAPYVAGTAALMLSASPHLAPAEVRSVFEYTADDVNGGGFDNELGHGRINAHDAVFAAARPEAPTNLAVTGRGGGGFSPPVLNWDDTTDPDLSHYEVYRKRHATTYQYEHIGSPTSSSYTDFETSLDPGGELISYYVVAVDTDDYVSTHSNTVYENGDNVNQLRRAEQAEDVPASFSLMANTPNPFSGHTSIRLALPEASEVTLVVYDVMGREVVRLVDEAMSPGFHDVAFEASNLPSGVYLYRMTAGEAFVDTRRLVVVR